MKSYDEMYQSLLSRYEDYQKKKEKRKHIIKCVVPVLACFCFTVTTVIFVNQARPEYGPMTPDITEHPIAELPEITSFSDTSVSTMPVSESKFQTDMTTSVIPVSESDIVTYGTSAPVYIISEVSDSEKTETSVTQPVVSENISETTSLNGVSETEPTSSIEITTTLASAQTQPVTEIISEQTTSETIVTTDFQNQHIIYFGYPENSEFPDNNHYAPSSPQIIAMKCNSFCASDEKLTVDVVMADKSLSYEHYWDPGYYQYEVCPCDSFGYSDIYDEKFIINNQCASYKKEYSEAEKNLFDITGKNDDYDEYYHESAVIDFSNYLPGDSGKIKFSFKRVYNEDPDHLSYLGNGQYMYYYAGEKGTAVSCISIENAADEYYKVIESMQ